MMTGTAFWNSAKKDENAFIFSVTVSSDSLSFQLPTYNGGIYNAKIDWGDNTTDNLTSWNDVVRTHTYVAAGTYDIKMTGVFEGWLVANYSDRLKITEIKQWGILKMRNYGPGTYFYGAANMIVSASDILDVSSIVSAYSFFRNCSSITEIPSINDWDWSNVTDFRYFLNGCGEFNQEIDMDVPMATSAEYMFGTCAKFNSKIRLKNSADITTYRAFIYNNLIFNSEIDIDTSSTISLREFAQGANKFNHPCVLNYDTTNVADMRTAFYLAADFNQPIGDYWNTPNLANIDNMLRGTSFNNDSLKNIDATGITSGINFLFGETLDTAFYDNLLIGWAAQSLNSGVTMHFGSSKYTAGGAAEAARTTLVSTYGWTITDGGAA